MTDPQLRAEALAQRFRDIAATRMRGLPLLNPALAVECHGFARQALGAEAGDGLLGVLITPWCMNLIWLPEGPAQALADGDSREYAIGGRRLDFIGAHDDVFGPYQSCSLFSPMFEFADQAAARATAAEVLALLRRPAAPAATAIDRRSLLFGRLAGARR